MYTNYSNIHGRKLSIFLPSQARSIPGSKVPHDTKYSDAFCGFHPMPHRAPYWTKPFIATPTQRLTPSSPRRLPDRLEESQWNRTARYGGRPTWRMSAAAGQNSDPSTKEKGEKVIRGTRLFQENIICERIPISWSDVASDCF